MGKQKILVVDDAQEVRDYINEILTRRDYNFSLVSTPDEAINYNEKIGLVITDFCFYDQNKVKLDKNGIDIILELRKRMEGLPAILMSSNLTQRTLNFCNERKINTFKKYEDDKTPVNEDKLIYSLENIFSIKI